MVHASFVTSESWSPCASLVWNDGFPTPLGELSMFTNPIKAPEIRFSSSHFRKQHLHHEKAVSRTSLTEAIYAWPCESVWRQRADSPHSRPHQGIWGLINILAVFVVKY
ncbi:unnamed protein product [Schistosoma margrebowiei]|uniref:Uncharacterized protein n=1 Tax=Schistosoma margrebowiei TaxID=48269 RepID=A0A3P8F5X0_9TREM|nr:unnamed protein product [Schistosoma margrebowiei]